MFGTGVVNQSLFFLYNKDISNKYIFEYNIIKKEIRRIFMKASIENIPANYLDYYIEANREQTVIVDVGKRIRFEKRHINGAVNIPYDEMIEGKYNLPHDKIIILYCDRGGTSMMAAKYLITHGYEVKNVVGGLRSYRGKNIVE